ncbi:MAG: cysteine desulfurase family protein [Candidatus Saccharimonadales bacterium]
MKQIYLDYAAATPLDKDVQNAMLPFMGSKFFNPSADYQAAREVKATLNQARSSVAAILSAKPGEIIFCAGGTEANNLAIKGVMDQFPDALLLTSAIEHESVLAPAAQYNHALIKVDAKGRLDLSDLTNQLNERTVLVSVMYANNEIGTIQPLKQVAQALSIIRAERRKSGNKLPLLFHSDACQAGNFLDLHVSRIGVDLMTLNGGKVYGPKQSGILYVRAGVKLKPLIDGGRQEAGLRSGTENVAADIGFAAALSFAQQQRDEQSHKQRELRDYFMLHLAHEFEPAIINGSIKQRLPNNVHVTFPKADNEVLLIGLDRAGIMAAAGSACSASSSVASHVLLAMGLSDAKARASLRFTLGRSTTKAEIDRTISVLKTLLK